MGSYDIVHVPCPKCQYPAATQSKGGRCNFVTYELDTAPAAVLTDVNRGDPITCEKCGAIFKVHLVVIATPILIPIGGRSAEKDEDG